MLALSSFSRLNPVDNYIQSQYHRNPSYGKEKIYLNSSPTSSVLYKADFVSRSWGGFLQFMCCGQIIKHTLSSCFLCVILTSEIGDKFSEDRDIRVSFLVFPYDPATVLGPLSDGLNWVISYLFKYRDTQFSFKIQSVCKFLTLVTYEQHEDRKLRLLNHNNIKRSREWQPQTEGTEEPYLFHRQNYMSSLSGSTGRPFLRCIMRLRGITQRWLVHL